MPWGDNVTVVNRTKKPLSFLFDGMTHVLKPGENPNIQESLAGFAKSKFPAMGTEDYLDPASFICLIGVKEWNDPITPLEQTDAAERFDRSSMPAPVTKKGEAGKLIAGPKNTWRPMTDASLQRADANTVFKAND